MTHKAGFVNIIGKPNVGKSTLMNKMVGENVSIITSKAQTTRHRIMGIVNSDDFQIVYSDTPGVLDPKYKLQESMMKFVHSALKDADILLLVAEIKDTPESHEHILKWVENGETPLFVLLNKIDTMEQDAVVEKIEAWKARLPKAIVAPISALHGFNTDLLLERIIEYLPACPPYFPKDELTDKSMRFFVSEIVREKILLSYQQEIPYSCEVEVEAYVEEENIIRIRCIIYVARDSQKGIMIGHQGKMLKKVGTEARKDIEEFVGKKVFLETYVKVDKDWRDDEKKLRKFGYLE